MKFQTILYLKIYLEFAIPVILNQLSKIPLFNIIWKTTSSFKRKLSNSNGEIDETAKFWLSFLDHTHFVYMLLNSEDK